MRILDEVDAHVGKRVDLAARMGLNVTTLNSIVKQREQIEKCFSRCGPSFSKSRKSLKMSPMEELETTLASWFKQARTSNLAVDGSHLREKALHIYCDFVGRALKITQIPSSRWNMSRHFVSFTVVPLDFAQSRPYEAVLAIMRLLPARPRKDAKCRDIFLREDGI